MLRSCYERVEDFGRFRAKVIVDAVVVDHKLGAATRFRGINLGSHASANATIAFNRCALADR